MVSWGFNSSHAEGAMNASRSLLYVLACAGAVCLLGDQELLLRTSVPSRRRRIFSPRHSTVVPRNAETQSRT